QPRRSPARTLGGAGLRRLGRERRLAVRGTSTGRGRARDSRSGIAAQADQPHRRSEILGPTNGDHEGAAPRIPLQLLINVTMTLGTPFPDESDTVPSTNPLCVDLKLP